MALPLGRTLLIALFAVVAAPTLANCNPPPLGLGPDQWNALCINEIRYDHQQLGAGRDYATFVNGLYLEYANYVPPNVQPTQCSQDGQSYCNSSGWLMTCTGGQWLTGAVNCNQ